MIDVTVQPSLAVGIVKALEVEIEFIRGYEITGLRRFDAVDFKPFRAEPIDKDAVFEIKNVVIGIGFHWQRQENQRFNGAIELVEDEGNIVVINHVGVEDYITSVISSEMSATSFPELLKAHAVISRSWVLAQIGNKISPSRQSALIENDEEIVRWYDRENHKLFDVCADDHCQRYQGITRKSNPNVERAVVETLGEVLTYGGQICDARFSKCCGGALEEFQYCWDNEPKAYLRGKSDNIPSTVLPNLTDNFQAKLWINSSPDVFCNTNDVTVLSQVLNNYDRETADFFRWEVKYTPQQLRDIIKIKSGHDLGDIKSLEPLHRGVSGRIYRLRIVGEKKTVIIGKELEIRRWLSLSHLYSSAFSVDEIQEGEETKVFVLRGAGWGHGVGLCQIGAAVMSRQGYDYRQILSHYYPGSELSKNF